MSVRPATESQTEDKIDKLLTCLMGRVVFTGANYLVMVSLFKAHDKTDSLIVGLAAMLFLALFIIGAITTIITSAKLAFWSK